MATESYILAVCNVQKTDTLEQQRRTIKAALLRADYVIFNEAGSQARKILRELNDDVWGVTFYLGGAGQLPHAWRRSKFEPDGNQMVKKVMRGGRRIVRPVRRARRLGPSRFGVGRRMRLRRSGLRNRILGAHLMARVFTKHGWRKPLYFSSVKTLNSWMWATRTQSVPDLIAGDMNRNPRVPFGPRWKRVPLKADLGGNTYTHCYIRPNGGHITARSKGEIANVPSDHDIQLIEVTLSDQEAA